MKTTNASDINQPLVISIIEQDLKILRLINKLRAVEQELSAGHPDLSAVVLAHLGLVESDSAYERYLNLLARHASEETSVYVSAPQVLEELLAGRDAT